MSKELVLKRKVNETIKKAFDNGSNDNLTCVLIEYDNK